MPRLPLGTEIEAEHPPHGGHWERVAPGKLRLVSTTYPQTETPAEAAHRAAQEAAPLAAAPDHVLTESAAEAAAREAEIAPQAPSPDPPKAAEPPPAPRASRKKEG